MHSVFWLLCAITVLSVFVAVYFGVRLYRSGWWFDALNKAISDTKT